MKCSDSNKSETAAIIAAVVVYLVGAKYLDHRNSGTAAIIVKVLFSHISEVFRSQNFSNNGDHSRGAVFS